MSCAAGPRPGDTWHLDEVFLTLDGQRQSLWRAVDQHGNVLDILGRPERDTRAAVRFLRRLLKNLEYGPRVVVTDRLHSCGAAHRRVMPGVEHRTSKYLNNRAENSHQPTRRRERATQGFRSAGGAQRFPAAFRGISPRFRPPPPPDDRPRLPRREDHPLRRPGPGHRRRRPARRGLSTGPKPAPATPRRAVRDPRTQQRDSAPKETARGLLGEAAGRLAGASDQDVPHILTGGGH